MLSIDEVLQSLDGLDVKQRRMVEVDADAILGERPFIPLPGPQSEAYFSAADIILYGGSAGGGKSGLLVGLPVNDHSRSIIFRRESSQTDGLVAFGKEVIGDGARFNGTDLEWSWPNGRTLKLAGMKEPDDWRKYAGRERDYMGFDEAGEFLESQVLAIMAWLRSEPGRRCRVVLASNPPRSSDGAWLIEWFAPWLDPQHPRPAVPGELRWAAMVDGKTVWVDGPGEVEIGGEKYLPMSRTFIPAALKDNPYRDTPEYRARLQSLPEPLRSQLLYGDFTANQQDDSWQCIPTAWIRAAQERWTKASPVGVPMCAIGVDVAQGGGDESVLAIRHDGWFAPLVAVPGDRTPDGKSVAGLVIQHRRDRAKVIVDIGGGWGGDAYAHLRENSVDAVSYMGVKDTTQRTADRTLKLTNVRSAAYWRFREALDPSQPGGSPIALPLDSVLVADLCAPKYEVTPNGIKVEAKERVVKKLGRSPDRGDAVVMAWWDGVKALNLQGGFAAGRGKQVKVNLGYVQTRR